MEHLTILRKYATKSHPENLPPSVLFDYNDTSITIFDAFPKSTFHFLILPRPRLPFTEHDLTDLRTLLNSKRIDKEQARELLEGLGRDAQKLREAIEQEMLHRYGFKWKIWTGFHALPSMSHLHLHVISDDLCSEKMTRKEHYNSFHPDRGFFLHYDDVMSWFEVEPARYKQLAALRTSQYEPIKKEALNCFRCGMGFQTMPKLKEHLQYDFDQLWETEPVGPSSQ